MPSSNVWAAARSIARSVLLLLIPPAASAPAQSAKIILPTDNHALFSGDSAGFYQYVRRDFEGQISNAWEGGQYGFVRNPQRIGTAIIYTRFHEGIDIRLRGEANAYVGQALTVPLRLADQGLYSGKRI
jgi:hypothetical protein